MKEVDYKPIIKRMIALSWLFLGICFLFKLFGADIFKVYTNNESFKTFCKLTETFLPLKFVVCVLSSALSSFLLWIPIVGFKKAKTKPFIFISIVTIIIFVAAKLMFVSLSGFFDVFLCFLYPLFFIGKPSLRWLNILTVNGSYIVFSLVSLFIKEISITNVMTDNTYVALLFSVDVWIMQFLLCCYFYIKDGEK